MTQRSDAGWRTRVVASMVDAMLHQRFRDAGQVAACMVLTESPLPMPNGDKFATATWDEWEKFRKSITVQLWDGKEVDVSGKACYGVVLGKYFDENKVCMGARKVILRPREIWDSEDEPDKVFIHAYIKPPAA